MDVLALVIRVLDSNVEHLGEVLAEAVTCSALNTSAIGWDVSLHGGCILCGVSLSSATESICFRRAVAQLEHRAAQ